ncbi:hypothetical protein MMC16_003960 [Acarospora aff. strigata]|nr:hypothetical protein [Acarospora aff. strigata]
MLSVTTIAGLAALALLFWCIVRVGRRPPGYPPGPPTLPILGNIHQLPTKDAHLQFQEWAREYGPIYSLIIGTQTMIVLSSDQVVKDLLDKRSAIYSDRLDMYIGQKLCSGDLRFLMMRYGPTWRMFRKMMHQVPYQDLENKQMLYEMLEDPTHFLEHIRRYSNSLTTSMVFGWRTTTSDDPKMVQLFEGFSEFVEINQTGTAALMDSFPILRWFPDSILPTQAKAKALHKVEKKLYLNHWLKAKTSIEDGTAQPCFSVDIAKQQKEQGFSDDQAAYVTGSLLEAGSDTTASTLYAFVQAMILFPDVQKKAQAELDRVVSPDRLPTMDDYPNLQYLRGCVKESLRWMPTAPLGGVPHAVTQDDAYMGYHIPRGAGVINNVYAIHMDPKRHPQPRRFDPDRYKADFQSLAESATNPDVSKRDQFVFGAGRRICQGMHVAEQSLYLGMARLLWGFDVRPVLDAEGNVRMPDPERLTQGFVVMPVPFEARITPRSPGRAGIVKRAWREAEGCLDRETGQWESMPEGMALSKL